MIFLLLFFITISSFLWTIKLAINVHSDEKRIKFEEFLKKEKLVSNFIETMQWHKNINPRGGLISPKKAKENYIKGLSNVNDQYMAQEYIEFIYLNHKELHRRFFITGGLFVIMLLELIFFEL